MAIVHILLQIDAVYIAFRGTCMYTSQLQPDLHVLNAMNL
jgi:hypothetical protein